MRDPWTPRPTSRDHLASLRSVVLRSAFAVAVVVTIGLEDAARAAADLIRRTFT